MKSNRRSFLKGVLLSAFYGTGCLAALPKQTEEVKSLGIEKIKKDIESVLQSYIFEPNDAKTRRHIEGTLNAYLEKAVSPSVGQAFCNEENNTSKTIDSGELHAEVILLVWQEDGVYRKTSFESSIGPRYESPGVNYMEEDCGHV